MGLKLLIGNKNYSSWSLRPWLALKAAGVPFDEEVLPIFTETFAAALDALGVPRKVPVLLDDGFPVWESLAIIEHIAERFPAAPVWPSDAAARAEARAVSSEMHAGFHAVRQQLPMNLWRPPERRAVDARAEADITRITQIWRAARSRFGAGGEYLYGAFSAADAMFAPVAARFRTYAIPLDLVSSAYVAAIHAHPAFVAWRGAALAEPWLIEEDEVDWPLVKRES